MKVYAPFGKQQQCVTILLFCRNEGPQIHSDSCRWPFSHRRLCRHVGGFSSLSSRKTQSLIDSGGHPGRGHGLFPALSCNLCMVIWQTAFVTRCLPQWGQQWPVSLSVPWESLPGFTTLLFLVVLGGVGIAAFHPQGAVVTAEAGDQRRGYQMAVFITGGMIGYSIGPIYITSVITLAGLNNSYWAALPGVLMSAYLLKYGPSPQTVEKKVRGTHLRERLKENRRLLLIHYSLVVVRSINQIVFVAFLPLYLTQRGHSANGGSSGLDPFSVGWGHLGTLGWNSGGSLRR